MNVELPPAKINNNELFAKTLETYPPEYKLGDQVLTSMGIAFVTGRVFNEREKNWKYTVNVFGLNNINTDSAKIYGKYGDTK